MELPTTILLVDDDEVFRSRLARAFRERGLLVTDFGESRRALEGARQVLRIGHVALAPLQQLLAAITQQIA